MKFPLIGRLTPRAMWVALAALLALCALPGAGHAQGDDLQALLSRLHVVTEEGRQLVEVDLPTVLQLTLERSITLKSNRLNLNIAQSDLIAAQERNNPTLKNSLAYTRSVSSSFLPSPANFATLSGAETVTLSSQLSKKTSSGIIYGLGYSEVRARSRGIAISKEGAAPTTGSFTEPVDVAALSGTMSIPFFQDAGAEINDIPVRLAEVGVQSSQLSIRQKELGVLSDISNTYWRLVGLQESLARRREAVKLSEQLLQDNQARLRAGVLSPADVQASETQLARDRANALEFRLDIVVVEDQVRAALDLKDLPYGFKAVDKPMSRQNIYDSAALQAKVYANEPSLQLLRAQLKSSEYTLEQALNLAKPNLDLDLSYVLNGYSSSPLTGVTGFAQTDLHGYSAMLTWTVPLYDYKTPEAINRSNLQIQQLKLQIRDLESTLTVQLQSALRLLEFSRADVEASHVATELAKAQLKNEIERFRLGKTTGFQVAQLQQDTRAAEEAEILARIRYEGYQTQLLILTGDVYDYYKLQPKTSGGSDGAGYGSK